MSAASPAASGMSEYERQVGSPIRGSSKAGCAPMNAWTTNAPITAASRTGPSSRLFRSSRISSSTKATAARGELNAAARPAAAPAAAAARFCCFGTPSRPATVEATLPPSCTLGPSRPRLWPPPMLKALAEEFHPGEPHRRVAEVFPKGELELGHAAPRRFRAEARQQPPGQRGDHRHDPQADPRKPARRDLRRVDEARPENPIDHHLEGDRDQPRQETVQDDRRQESGALWQTPQRGSGIWHGRLCQPEPATSTRGLKGPCFAPRKPGTSTRR